MIRLFNLKWLCAIKMFDRQLIWSRMGFFGALPFVEVIRRTAILYLKQARYGKISSYQY